MLELRTFQPGVYLHTRFSASTSIRSSASCLRSQRKRTGSSANAALWRLWPTVPSRSSSSPRLWTAQSWWSLCSTSQPAIPATRHVSATSLRSAKSTATRSTKTNRRTPCPNTTSSKSRTHVSFRYARSRGSSLCVSGSNQFHKRTSSTLTSVIYNFVPVSPTATLLCTATSASYFPRFHLLLRTNPRICISTCYWRLWIPSTNTRATTVFE